MTNSYTAKFGVAGNSKRFYDEGCKSTFQAPPWLEKNGLDAYEYQAGNGIFGSDETFSALTKLFRKSETRRKNTG